MAMFDQPFKSHIIKELEYRRDFDSIQSVFHPHVRVTSLIRGNLNMPPWNKNQQLNGFTLGIPDVNAIKTLDSYFNASGQEGTAVGLTYQNGTEIVTLGTGRKKLPSPGITDVNISTQSKGGFIFKGTINLKFYGKEQYDFIYQIFLRPGNPILIEYGHTRTGSKSAVKDLGFFTDLNPGLLQRFRDNFKINKALPTTRNSGAVVGLVSNFSVRLNEQNEYEATIELVNALEFLFTMNPEDTFLDYSHPDGYLSKSIRANFGIGEDEEWEPEHDTFFKFIIESSYSTRTATMSGGVESVPDYGPQVILPGEWTREKAFAGEDDKPVFGRADDMGSSKQEVLEYASKYSDTLYISLNYFLSTLLTKIINASYMETQHGLAKQAFMTEKEFEDIATTRQQRALLDESGAIEELRRREVDVARAQDLTMILDDQPREFYFDELRSTDISKVIINNTSIYAATGRPGDTKHFWELRRKAYNEKYVDKDVPALFLINDDWKHKEKYWTGGSVTTGIFINYSIIRNTFLSSNSVAESIQRVLNTVNSVTSDILDLKMKYIPVDLHGNSTSGDSTEAYKIAVYDEGNSVSAQRPKLHTFFEKGVSEAISYDFDFSLPSFIAAGVMASTFKPQENKAFGGYPKEKAFIDYGYALKNPRELAIVSLLDDDEPLEAPVVETKATYTDLSEDNSAQAIAERNRRSEALEELEVEGLREFKKKEGKWSLLFSRKFWKDSPEKNAIFDDPAWKSVEDGGTGDYDPDTGIIWWNKGQPAREPYLVPQLDGPPITMYKYFAPDGTSLTEVNQAQAEYLKQTPPPDEEEGQFSGESAEEEKLFRKILGYQELMPAAMKAVAVGQGLYNIFPASPKLTIKIQGLDGFRFGDLFEVRSILPYPYDDNGVFMLTGYEHTISSEGWFTDISATLIASKPQDLAGKLEIGPDGQVRVVRAG